MVRLCLRMEIFSTIFIFLGITVPLYSTVAAGRAMGLFKENMVATVNAVIWTFLLQFLLYAMVPSGAMGWESVPFLLLGFFIYGLIPAILCLGLKRWETYVFTLAGAIGATIPAGVMAIGIELARPIRM